MVIEFHANGMSFAVSGLAKVPNSDEAVIVSGRHDIVVLKMENGVDWNWMSVHYPSSQFAFGDDCKALILGPSEDEVAVVRELYRSAAVVVIAERHLLLRLLVGIRVDSNHASNLPNREHIRVRRELEIHDVVIQVNVRRLKDTRRLKVHKFKVPLYVFNEGAGVDLIHLIKCRFLIV